MPSARAVRRCARVCGPTALPRSLLCGVEGVKSRLGIRSMSPPASTRRWRPCVCAPTRPSTSLRAAAPTPSSVSAISRRCCFNREARCVIPPRSAPFSRSTRWQTCMPQFSCSCSDPSLVTSRGSSVSARVFLFPLLHRRPLCRCLPRRNHLRRIEGVLHCGYDLRGFRRGGGGDGPLHHRTVRLRAVCRIISCLGAFARKRPLFTFYNETNECCLRVFNHRFPVSTDYRTVLLLIWRYW